MTISKTAIILIALALLVLGAAGYLLFGTPDTDAIVSAEGTPATRAELTFISLTSRIDPVEFNTSILMDPRFSALRDIRTAIIPESTGRIDPFAPLGK